MTDTLDPPVSWHDGSLQQSIAFARAMTCGPGIPQVGDANQVSIPHLVTGSGRQLP